MFDIHKCVWHIKILNWFCFSSWSQPASQQNCNIYIYTDTHTLFNIFARDDVEASEYHLQGRQIKSPNLFLLLLHVCRKDSHRYTTRLVKIRLIIPLCHTLRPLISAVWQLHNWSCMQPEKIMLPPTWTSFWNTTFFLFIYLFMHKVK